jgi:acetyl esterase/lipase
MRRAGSVTWRRRRDRPHVLPDRLAAGRLSDLQVLRDAGVPVTADRFQAIIHDFVMLNALADTNAARGAVTLATDTLRTVLSDNP